MAFFARRAVQRSVDSLRGKTLTPKQAEGIVAQLNSGTRQVISWEWEAIALAAFAKHSDIEYETAVGSGHPDLYVRDTGETKDITFIADLATVSDHGIEERNPYNFLYEEILTIGLKLGVDFEALGWHVGYRMEGQFPDRRVKVLLPSREDLHPRLQASIKPFLQRIKAEPHQKHELVWADSDVDFRLCHNPSQRRSDFGGPIIPTVPYSKTDNSLYRRLKKKAERLSKTKFAGMRGVILGDGDCYALRRRPGANGSSYDAQDIVRYFLEKHRSVAFVTTSHYEHEMNFSNRGHWLRHTVYFQPSVSDDVREKLLYFLDDVFGEIPRPIQSPNNAVRDVLGRRELSRGCALGAYHWSPPRLLKVPVRVFLGLLAGSLSPREFKILFYQTMPREGGPLVSFFSRVLMSSGSIQNVFVEAMPDRDNDWIAFDCSASAQAFEVRRATDRLSCQIKTSDLVQYFAGLDYKLQCGQPNHSSLHDLSPATREFVKTMLSQGRLLESAHIASAGELIELHFGDRDAAISEYW
jgi:hypothetical protein